MSEEASSDALPRCAFPVTRWSVVLAAKDRAQPQSAQALETLCRAYWYPLSAFVRCSGWDPADAQDLTQDFFACLLEKNYLRVVEPEKGRFRTFLRFAIKRFLANQLERRCAAKRGGNHTHVSFDTSMAEERFVVDGAGILPPDRLYDRQWALTLLNEATTRLARDYEAAGKSDELSVLKPFLTAERGAIPYKKIAAALGISEGAARVTVHRLRKRFREMFLETIADTVSCAAEARDEMRDVLAILSESA